jgi:hypothetical protein
MLPPGLLYIVVVRAVSVASAFFEECTQLLQRPHLHLEHAIKIVRRLEQYSAYATLALTLRKRLPTVLFPMSASLPRSTFSWPVL